MGGGGASGSPSYTHDFIELYNRGSAEIDLAGWLLSDENQGEAITLPPGTLIAAGAYLLPTLPFGLGQGDSAVLRSP